VRDVEKKLLSIRPKTLTLGFQSLAESLLRRGWLNPFPKIRSTERPDTAAAELVEGAVIVMCDTSPQAMILPTTAFDYLQQTDDFYFPPLTGTYLRLVRTLIFLLSVVATPLWVLAIQYQQLLPPALHFIVPEEAALPLLAQLLLVEVAIDGLKIASLNTPNTLSSSLSIIGGLILGDFAVGVGWLTQDVILYMAFVAVATFAGQNPELGYALKFVRILSLLLTAAFGIYGFVGSMLVFVILLISNRTATGRNYLYPLIPFDPKALWRLFVRVPKYDFEDKQP
jgi:stage V sporulation protein AF